MLFRSHDALPISVVAVSFKELYAKMPVVLVRAVQYTGIESKDTYVCPVYKTQDRGPTFVFTAGLRTKAPAAKWILGGVGLLMDVA